MQILSSTQSMKPYLSRIKRYRKQKKISLDELSRQAGVSKGALVEIEGCRANPSIALLCRLAAAMGVSVADFVDVSSKPTVHLIAEDEIPELWEGEKAVEQDCSQGRVALI